MDAWNEQFSSSSALRYGDRPDGFDKSLFLMVFQKHLGMALLLRLLKVLLGPISGAESECPRLRTEGEESFLGCPRGDPKRVSSLPASRVFERDDFGLAGCPQESCLGCG